MRVSGHLDHVELSRIRGIGEKIKVLEDQGRDVIRLHLGEPDFTTPENIIASAKAALDRGQTHYAPNRGIPVLRNAIAEKLQTENGIAYDPETEVLVTSGCAEGLYLVFSALLDPGDEVIIVEPAYIAYLQLARIVGAKSVLVHAGESGGWLPDIDDLRKAVTDKTKLLILNSPCNPTGAVYPRELIEQIAQLAIEKDFLVLSDEVYEKLLYDGAEHVSIGSINGMRERTLTINGFSKAYAMTGWRLAYIAAPKEFILPMVKIHQYSMSSSNIIAEYAGVEALKNGAEACARMLAQYSQRRRLLLDAFERLCIPCAAPKGTFYIYPNVVRGGLGGREFAERLLADAGVAVVPGTAFDSFYDTNIRISYASSMENLREFIARLEDMLTRLIK